MRHPRRELSGRSVSSHRIEDHLEPPYHVSCFQELLLLLDRDWEQLRYSVEASSPGSTSTIPASRANGWGSNTARDSPAASGVWPCCSTNGHDFRCQELTLRQNAQSPPARQPRQSGERFRSPACDDYTNPIEGSQARIFVSRMLLGDGQDERVACHCVLHRTHGFLSANAPVRRQTAGARTESAQPEHSSCEGLTPAPSSRCG
jgi:hypothetical protein